VISIHAPARGATSKRFFPATLLLFQSTLPHGERLLTQTVYLSRILFQSTLPHGERPIYSNAFSYYNYFNPRSRTGSDIYDLGGDLWQKYFNPRSRTGSDLDNGDIYYGVEIFQSTLPHGERQHNILTVYCKYNISIHAPARGATLLIQ